MSYELQPRPGMEATSKVSLEAVKEMQTVLKQDTHPILWTLSAIGLFLLAVGINIALWASDKFGNLHVQTAHVYTVQSPISAYLHSSATSSTTIFSDLTSLQPIAISLVYSWILWKFSLVVFAFLLSASQPSLLKRLLSAGVVFLLLLTLDILGTIFILSFYQDGIFLALAALIIFVATIPNGGAKFAMQNVLLPLLYLGGVLVLIGLILPTLYNVYFNNLSNINASVCLIYGWPIIDILLYALLLVLNNSLHPASRIFVSSFQFLILGVDLGMIMLAGYTEVEFYFLLFYYMLRNVFGNRLMRGWRDVVNNPIALPLWPLLYYSSYILNFLPIIAVGKMVVSKGFLSPYLSAASPLFYSLPNPNYFSSSYTFSEYNSSFNGNIIWITALIFWLGYSLTINIFSRKPTFIDLFVCLFGIQLFFLGLISGLSSVVLAINAHI